MSSCGTCFVDYMVIFLILIGLLSCTKIELKKNLKVLIIYWFFCSSFNLYKDKLLKSLDGLNFMSKLLDALLFLDESFLLND